MKNLKFILSLLMIVVFVSSPVFAANDIVVHMDGEKTVVRRVPVVMDGQSIYSDVPTFIHKGSTLVPLRFVAEHYGSDVEWDEKTNSAIVNHKDKNIVMTIDSEEVLVNGKSRVIENNAKPKLVNTGERYSSTMVPLRFISETLGYKVGYNEERGIPFINSKEQQVEEEKDGVTSISLVRGNSKVSKLRVEASDKMNILDRKDGNIIDITIEDMQLANRDLESSRLTGSPMKRVDISQDGQDVKIQVELEEDYAYDLIKQDGGKTFILSPVSKVNGIKKEKFKGEDSIVIYKDRDTKINKMTLNNPKRLVFDLMDSSLGYNYKEFNYSLGPIKNVRASQFSPDNSYSEIDRVVRIVLDLSGDVKEEDIDILETKDKIVITPKIDLSELVTYKLNGRKASLDIELEGDSQYEFSYDEKSKLIRILVDSDRMRTSQGRMDINDGMVKDISLSKSGGQTRLDIKLAKDLEVEDLNQGKGSSIKIGLEAEEIEETEDSTPEASKPAPTPVPTNPGAKTIVLDAGHGGVDPGAVSNGVREKDIALAVTKKVDGILQGKGFNTIMTRDDDTFVSLGGRAKIANDADADLFVSIHANAFSGSAANGIETLHSGEAKSKSLSQSIQNELIKETGATNRGIKHRPNLAVLRGTRMPATLVELGFITNPTEVAKMQTETYQMKLAEAIANGIEKFFGMFD